MKNISILLVATITMLVAVGCGKTENPPAQNIAANTAANTTSSLANAAKPVTSQSAPPELPASSLKPEDINLDKPVPAEELRNAVMGNEAAWKGKEVAVIGEYNGHSTSKLDSGDKYSLNVARGPQNVPIKCDGRVAPPADVKDKRKDRVFKGTVKDVNKAFQQVYLEPCEVIK
jgi:hypothetical protein